MSDLSSNLKLRKPPTERTFQKDEMQLFRNEDSINDFNDINECLLEILPESFYFVKKEEHAVFYRMESNAFSVPEMTYCINIDENLSVKMFNR